MSPQPTPLPQTTRQRAIEAVADAAKLAQRLQRQLDQLPSLQKADASPVTVADHAIQGLIAERLYLPGPHPLMGEESSEALRAPEMAPYLQFILTALQPYWPGVDADRFLGRLDAGGHDGGEGGYWTVDPIDGTQGFLAGRHFAIALAFVDAGAPRFAALGCPRLGWQGLEGDGVVFEATFGGGCRQRAVTDLQRCAPVQVRAVTPPAVVQSAESRHCSRENQAYAAAAGLRFDPELRVDSQVKYGLLARGDVQAYLRLRDPDGYKEANWDHAAGALIATEAGAVVTDQDGRPLDFSRGRALNQNNGVVAAEPSLHAQLMNGRPSWRWRPRS